MTEWDDLTKNLKPVTWDEIKEFYQRNFSQAIPEDWEEAMCFAWSKSRQLRTIDLLATGYRWAQHKYEPK